MLCQIFFSSPDFCILFTNDIIALVLSRLVPHFSRPGLLVVQFFFIFSFHVDVFNHDGDIMKKQNQLKDMPLKTSSTLNVFPGVHITAWLKCCKHDPRHPGIRRWFYHLKPKVSKNKNRNNYITVHINPSPDNPALGSRHYYSRYLFSLIIIILLLLL